MTCGPGPVAACMVGLMLLPVAAQEADRSTARLVQDVLETRVALAVDALMLGAEAVYRFPSPAAITDPEPPLPEEVESKYSLATAGELRQQWWRSVARGGGEWFHRFTFYWEGADGAEETVIDANPPQMGVTARAMPPQAEQHGFLLTLGLATKARQPLDRLVPGANRFDPAVMFRGHPCAVIASDTTELYLAEDLDYAPVRYVIRPDDGGPVKLELIDWWGYREGGALQLPRFFAIRSFTTGPDGVLYCRSSSVTCIDVAAVGEEAVAAVAPPDRHVPFVAGMKLRSMRPFRVGADPFLMWAYCQADGLPIGISISSLLRDTQGNLPEDQPAAPQAAPDVVG